VVIIVEVHIWRKRKQNTKSRMENGSCVQGCPHGAPKNSDGCTIDYNLCIDQCGPDLTSKYAPPCVTKCAWQAAKCRKKFLDCANGCGQLSIT
jgi:hypothetical protein